MAEPTTRIGIYLTPSLFNAAKAAYLVDWRLGGHSDTFARWIAGAIDAHAACTPQQRADLERDTSRATERSGSPRSFSIPNAIAARMRQAIAADQQTNRWPTVSAWVGDAIAAAVSEATRRAGGPLPEPPARLPNRLVR